MSNNPNSQLISIDIKHDEMLSYFKSIDDTLIPNLQSEKSDLKNILKNTQRTNVDTIMELKDKINDIRNEIKRLSNMKKNYFLENSKIIFN